MQLGRDRPRRVWGAPLSTSHQNRFREGSDPMALCLVKMFLVAVTQLIKEQNKAFRRLLSYPGKNNVKDTTCGNRDEARWAGKPWKGQLVGSEVWEGQGKGEETPVPGLYWGDRCPQDEPPLSGQEPTGLCLECSQLRLACVLCSPSCGHGSVVVSSVPRVHSHSWRHKLPGHHRC